MIHGNNVMAIRDVQRNRSSRVSATKSQVNERLAAHHSVVIPIDGTYTRVTTTRENYNDKIKY